METFFWPLLYTSPRRCLIAATIASSTLPGSMHEDAVLIFRAVH